MDKHRTADRTTFDLPADSIPPTPLMAILLLAIASLVGCQASAPIYVWQPPQLESAVGKRIMLAGIDGDPETTEPLLKQLAAQAPADAGRQFQLAGVEDLLANRPSTPPSGVQLASATDGSPSNLVISDLVITPVAREQGFDYVMRGTVLQKQTRAIRRIQTDDAPESAEPLTLSWRLHPLASDRPPIGMPLTVNLDDAGRRYPDLRLLGDPKQILMIAAARDTNRLIAPWTHQESVPLAKPRLLPGSRQVRRGNTLAKAGRWADAKAIWKSVADTYPLQSAALVNLSLASAAEQDFSTAKRLARKAIRRFPSKLARQTLVWIELRQRDYHEAFGLPDPPEGWFVTR